MVFYRDYSAGWLDSSVAGFLDDFPASYGRLRHVLITCLDSNTEPASLIETSPELSALKPWAKILGRGLLVPTGRLLDANRTTPIFFGFDEAWFFPNEPTEAKPMTGWIVGPSIIDDHLFDEIGEWMLRTSCSLGLGDGEGLNLVVKARGLARNLIGQSIKQSSARIRPSST